MEQYKDAIFGVIRHLLTTLGGVGATYGVATSSELEQVVGAIMVLVGFGWSIYNKRKTQ